MQLTTIRLATDLKSVWVFTRQWRAVSVTTTGKPVGEERAIRTGILCPCSGQKSLYIFQEPEMQYERCQ